MSVHPMQARLRATDPVLRTGRVRKILSTHIEADGPSVGLGTICSVEAQSLLERTSFQAEVVRIDEDRIVLSPFEHDVPTFSGALVRAHPEQCGIVPVGQALLGRAIDPLHRPLDGKGPPRAEAYSSLAGEAIVPLDRTSPTEILELGVRAIDGLLTLGKGQRVGIFAASGVGKTSLLTQVARQANADILIVCLVGERGREVEMLWNQGLDEETRSRTTLVAATSDLAAPIRVRAGYYALALAEYWRDQGKHVLLVLDSVTRLAMAMREIGLSAGEPPTVRAYTPGVFAAIPKLVERCGALRSGGAITAIMTVLSESDDVDDPICELMKSLLDGHIVLSRSLAEQGHFPPIDILRSVSRQAQGLVEHEHRRWAQRLSEWLSLHEASRPLIDAGLYTKGSNEALDRAIARQPEILNFLKQERDERSSLASTLEALSHLARGEG